MQLCVSVDDKVVVVADEEGGLCVFDVKTGQCGTYIYIYIYIDGVYVYIYIYITHWVLETCTVILYVGD
jgi:hypothetical protein